MITLPDSNIRAIAQRQKRILQLLLISIGLVVTAIWLKSVENTTRLHETAALLVLAATLAIGITSSVLVYRLAKALEMASPWIYLVCAFIPYIGVVTLLVINLQATAALKRKGIQVGLMGVDARDLEKL